ncbi:hypothetical protein [Povalibacter sp.]|uniref:hypothetical protein n=1 Tax=Povalibacter sp. TaxID=1962978 RepID=UPI002F3F20BF
MIGSQAIQQAADRFCLPASSPERRLGPCLLFALLIVPSAHAFEIERSQATYADKHYQYELVAIIDAPADRVQAVLRDYEHYPQLDSRILEARVIERPSSYVSILQTTVRACFGPFCRNVKRIERVEESPLELTAKADPQRSDVKFGETSLMLSVTNGRTRVSYRTSIVPDFWIPPIPGRRWLLHTLEDSTTHLFRGVEKRAQASGDHDAAPIDSGEKP